jgi:hypothetical protein
LQKENYRKVFERFVPTQAVDYCLDLWWDYRFEFKITKGRQTKLGDYRFHPVKKSHVVSVNNNLNPFAFLITYVHEVAHLVVYNDHKNRVSPHGGEWKANFKQLMLPMLRNDIFPDDVLRVLARHMKNPKASSYSDPKLIAALSRYDKDQNGVLLSQVKNNEQFIFNKRQFTKLELRRTRAVCKEEKSGRKYLISQTAKVQLAIQA